MRLKIQFMETNDVNDMQARFIPEAGERTAIPSPELHSAVNNLIVSYFNDHEGSPILPLKEFITLLEKQLILRSLILNLGNQSKTAADLGLKPTTLCEKLNRLSPKPPSKMM
jgi:DNA-binding protein Fis